MKINNIYFKPKILIIFLLGISSGLPFSLTATTLAAWLTDSGISIKSIGFVSSVALPYSLKFLWSPFIDNIKIPYFTNRFGRRRSWMFVIQILLMVVICALGFIDPNEDFALVMLVAALIAFCAASQDIIIDAYRIEYLPKELQGIGAAATGVGFRVGALLSSAGALYLSEYYSWLEVFIGCASLMLIGTFTVIFAPEPQNNNQNNSLLSFQKIVLMPFIDLFKRKKIILIFFFIIFFKLGDAFASALNTTFFMRIGFSKAEIASIVKVFGLFPTLAGSFVGGIMLYHMRMGKALWIAGLAQMLTNSLLALQAYIGYDTTYLAFTIGVEHFGHGIGGTIFISYLSSLCNISFTATQFALLTSLASVSKNLIAVSSGVIQETLGSWVLYFLFTVIAAIPGLVCLYLLRETFEEKKY